MKISICEHPYGEVSAAKRVYKKIDHSRNCTLIVNQALYIQRKIFENYCEARNVSFDHLSY